MAVPPLPSIRPARSEDLEGVLNILCSAFEMPRRQTAEVLYGDPDLRPDRFLVASVDGRPSGCLMLTSAPAEIASAPVPVAGISGLATVPEMQRRGVATALLRAAEEQLRDRGYAIALLQATLPEFYESRGWTVVADGVLARMRASRLRQLPCDTNVRAAAPCDRLAIAAFFEETSRGAPLRFLRPERVWERKLGLEHTALALKQGGLLRGYLFARNIPGKLAANGISDPLLRVEEVLASSRPAWQCLMQAAATATPLEWLEWSAASRDSALRVAGWNAEDAAELGLELKPAPPLLARLVSFERAVASLAPTWSSRLEAPLVLQCGSPGASGSTAFNLRPMPGGAFMLEPVYGSRGMASRLTACSATWAQLLFGRLSGEAAISTGALTVEGAWAGRAAVELLPRRDTAFSLLDAF